MEEVQSWWEVPAVAHFFYTFRTAFNLVFFEIAELESALLDMQDADMGVSLEQLVIRLLQGFYDKDEPVTEENWEEKLHELFNENLDDDENPLDKSLHFLQLTPRSKTEVLLKLCELRLDVEGALEEIKNISSEDMKAKCLGKDSQKNSYWYFCDERLYKEAESVSNGKAVKPQKGKDVSLSKNVKQTNTRVRRKIPSPDLNTTWTIACFNLSDWENLAKNLSKSRSTYEKELYVAIKEHVPLVQERVAEKDRVLRKRFMELAPKRASSRISRVQEMKKLEELKAHEAAEKARVKAEKERTELEAKKKKQEILDRQKRVEERHKIVEERAERAKLRELARATDSESSDEDEVPEKFQPRGISRHQWSAKNQAESESEESESKEDENYSESEDEEEENETSSYQRSSKRIKIGHTNEKKSFVNYSYRQRSCKEQSDKGQQRSSLRLRNCPKKRNYHDSSESESDVNKVPELNGKSQTNPRFQQSHLDFNKQSSSYAADNENDSSSDSDNASSESSETNLRENHINSNETDCPNSENPTNPNGSLEINIKNLSPRVTVYKGTFIKNSDISRWNSTLDSKGQKLHILHNSYDNLSSKKMKLEEVKSIRTITPIVASPLSKENHIYQQFHQNSPITYGKVTPSPSIIRLDFRKTPSNHQVSS